MEASLHRTLAYLQKLKDARSQGYRGSFTTDLTWLVDMAVNRRAGWPDDPGCYRGSAMPINGRYPKKAIGESYSHLRLLAQKINTPRLIMRDGELGEWRRLIRARLPHRIFSE